MTASDFPNTPHRNSTPIILAETEVAIDLELGLTQWVTSAGQYILEADYRVAGQVWQVHKGDADPYPSRPHAHCIAGPIKIQGCTLHLGTAELFRGRKGLNRYLAPRQFEALLEKIRPKFPGLIFPLPAST
jgi:hypothetical protein